MKSDLHPPEAGPDSDPVLYGVAAGLADLFPPIVGRTDGRPNPEPSDHEDDEQD